MVRTTSTRPLIRSSRWLARRYARKYISDGKTGKINSNQSGHAVNPGQYRAQNEKITDKLRGMFEKATGKKVHSSREVQML